MTCFCQNGAVCNADKAANVLQPDCSPVVPQKHIESCGVLEQEAKKRQATSGSGTYGGKPLPPKVAEGVKGEARDKAAEQPRKRPYGITAGHSKMRRLLRVLKRRGNCSVFCAAQRSGIRRREVVILLAWLQSAGYVVLKKQGKSNALISGTAALAVIYI